MAMIRPETEMKDSGIQWIGDIPNNWNIKPLYACLDEINQKNNPIVTTNILSLTNTDGVIPYSERGNQGNKSKENFEEYKVVYPNTIVANSMNILIGSVGLSKYEGCVSPVYYVYMAKPQVDIRYMNYLFQMEPFQKRLRQFANGILEIRLRVSSHDILHQKVAVPDYDEQQAIADYLDKTCSKIDEIIAEAKASIDEYKKLRISAVNDAVTHGIHNNAVKDSNVDWIGKIPDNWKIIITKRLFKIKKDIAGKEGYTVLSITQKGIIPKVFGGKGQFAADYSNYQLVNKGDFAMNHMDLLTGWLDISEYDGVTSPDYRVFVSTGYEDIYASYYKYVMQNCYSCRIYYGLGHGVAGMGRWRLPADMFLNFKLPMPPKAEQKEIADFLDKRTAEIDSLIAEKESLINDLEAYKKSLIYEVVTGKRRVV